MSREVLKSNAKRTVRLDVGAGGQPTVCKHFHAPGLGRLRDGRRARAEAAALQEAARRGLPVPEVLAVERNESSWTLRLQWIPRTRTLAEVTGGAGSRRTQQEHSAGSAGPPWQRPPTAHLARRVGQLLAAVEASGLRHPDPHPGNILVDDRGHLWLVDLARSRFAAPAAAVFEQALVRACAGLRECSSPGFRGLVFRAYLRARTVPYPAPAPLEIERRAVRQRRRDVAQRVRVWRRTSSSTIVEEGKPPTVRARHAGEQPAAGWRTVRLDGTRREADAIWAHLVRASLHRLPAARPRRVALGPPYFVEFDLPAHHPEPPEPAAVRALTARLRDRGLSLEGQAMAGPDGSALIPPLGRLRPLETR